MSMRIAVEQALAVITVARDAGERNYQEQIATVEGFLNIALASSEVDAPTAKAILQGFDEIEQQLAVVAERLRETASGLREWQRNGSRQNGSALGIRPAHAANRLDQLAERISATKD